MKYSLFVLLVLGYSYSLAQLHLEKDFTAEVPPQATTKEWFILNYAINEFKVSLTGQQLVIRPTKETFETILPVKGGKLVGIDHGEWGGRLLYIHGSQQPDTQKIMNGNIHHLFTWRDSIYFFNSLAHGSYNAGGLYRLDTSGQSFHPVKVMVFDNAPTALDITADSLFIVAHSCFFVVTRTGKTKLFPDAFWGGLYPNSVAVKSIREIYIGMRGGVAKVDLQQRAVLFYRYNHIQSSFSNEKPVEVKTVIVDYK